MKNKSTLFILLCSATLLLSAQAIQAEPVACKGMQQAPCSDSTSCRWVNTYKRSDGREINGYCRKLPGKKVKEVSARQETTDPMAEKS